MNGPGKYDHCCTLARHAAKAKGAIVIIMEGENGSGFSVQIPPENAHQIPQVLRVVADGIEEDLENETRHRQNR